ncbi:VOC family protein [Jeotgalibacillus campisalis]|uniref:Glyoxalase n=1 Tax=Jeotgalibacillus campisalis TaxID=220754 RepID=A0A0C2S371_9BACL|nr:VOC family protein [Jeotgalibacillus campisalis]KIL48434.1 glyoxalase [Jeotgalibacillus campisalis]
MYEGIHHVSLLVTDIERSKRFYGDTLGFEESVDRPAFDFTGAWYQVGNTQIHLIVHDNGKTLRGTNKIDSRDGHFAVRVIDMEAFLEKLKDKDIKLIDKPTNKTEWHQVFVADPDGNIIEFNR